MDKTSLEAAVTGLIGRRIPSLTGRTSYEIANVQPGLDATLVGSGRKVPSVLAWDDIKRVYDCCEQDPQIRLTPTLVDRILQPQYRSSSTMCALVLALREPERVMSARERRN